MFLLDVNALVALAWEDHIHHTAARRWFRVNRAQGWATTPMTESGFVRLSSNPNALPQPVSVDVALRVVRELRGASGHRFLADDVSPTDADFPPIHGHRQVTDAHLLTLARRNHMRLVTFDRGAFVLGGADVLLLAALG